MLVVIAQPDSRREEFAEEALALAGFRTHVATSWEEVMSLVMAEPAAALVISTRTPRAFPVTLFRFCAVPRRERPGVVLWGDAGEAGISGILGETDRFVSSECDARELVEAVTAAAELPVEAPMPPKEVDAANRSGSCIVAGVSTIRREELVRQLLVKGLRADGVGSAEELLVRLYIDEVRLVIVDLGLGDESALDMCRIARAWSEELAVVFWTEFLPDPVQHELAVLRGRVLGRSQGEEALVEAATVAGVEVGAPLSSPGLARIVPTS